VAGRQKEIPELLSEIGSGAYKKYGMAFHGIRPQCGSGKIQTADTIGWTENVE
jgi:hypothetical protein